MQAENLCDPVVQPRLLPLKRAKRRMSTLVRSMLGSPSTTHSANARPAPPAAAMPTEFRPAHTKKFRTSGASPRMNWLSGVKLSGPL